MGRRAVRGLAALALLAGAVRGGPPVVAAQIPPDAAWRVIDTNHFRVTFPEGLEPLARRAADRAELAYSALAGSLLEPPQGTIDLVVSDNTDYPNGFATPFPSNRIVVYATPPAGEPTIGYYDDWLYLVILHELTHVFHLDTASGVPEALRRAFGRNPVLFPGIFVPGWLTEGIATLYESDLTRAGRLAGTEFDMVLRTAALEDAFFPIDRATGDPVTWPAASARYVYGASFLEHLADRRGTVAVVDFIRAYGRRIVPYRLESAARHAFGRSFDAAWSEWADSLKARFTAQADSLRALAPVTQPEVLTGAGRFAGFPRFSPDGSEIAFAAAPGTEEPSTRVIQPDGSIRTLAARTTLGPSAWRPDGRGLVTAQLDYADPYRIYSDLVHVSGSGADRRLTRAARLLEPDVHPAGGRAVAVRNGEGSNRLVVVDLDEGAVAPLSDVELDTHWTLPRWSPDGRYVAASVWRSGGLFDVVVLDTTGAVVREITRDRALDLGAAWSPDGRYLLFSSDRTGIPNLFAYDLRRDSLLQVTNVLTGAVHPDVSPDGRWIAFALYRADGYHIARIPFEPERWIAAPPPRVGASEPHPPVADDAAGGRVRRYSPWPTVRPAAWSLIAASEADLGLGLGVSVAGEDLVERHAWSAEALAYGGGPRAEVALEYRYRGFGVPVVDAAVHQRWGVRSAAGERVVGTDTVHSALLRRDRAASLGLLWLRRRWRSSRWIQTSGEIGQLEFVWDDPEVERIAPLREFPLDAGAVVEVGFSSSRSYGISLGPQDGTNLVGRLEGRRYLEPFEGEETADGFVRLTTRTRSFHALRLPGFARHVVGVRLDAGAEAGSLGPGFAAGGASGVGSPAPLDPELFGSAAFPVRGYAPGVQTGNRAIAATLEYRFPIALVDRGVGLLPVFLKAVHGDLFADAGGAWCAAAADDCTLRLGAAPTRFTPLASLGAELGVDLTLGYAADLPLRVGVGVPLRSAPATTPARIYLRLGRSF